MKSDTEDIVYRCKDCEKYNLCEYYHGRKENSQICHYFEMPERKTGKWVNDEHDIPHCSCCQYIPAYDTATDDIYYSPYCPNCGAKMEVDE